MESDVRNNCFGPSWYCRHVSLEYLSVHHPKQQTRAVYKGSAIVGEYQRESNQIIGMTKETGHSFLSLRSALPLGLSKNIIYVLSVVHKIKGIIYAFRASRNTLVV